MLYIIHSRIEAAGTPAPNCSRIRFHPVSRQGSRTTSSFAAPAAGNGSRVDIRSVSRVGLSGVGTNARRIRTFLKKFAEASMKVG